jgi:hypothetical protein
MPVEETLELVATVRRLRVAPLGVAVLNRHGPQVFAPGDDEILARAGLGSGTLGAAGRHALQRALREREERQLAELLRLRVGMPLVTVDDRVHPVRSLDAVQAIGDRVFEQALATDPVPTEEPGGGRSAERMANGHAG